MTRFLFIVLLLLVLSGAPAYAEWILIGTNEGGNKYYADFDTIRRNGSLVKIWTLTEESTQKRKNGKLYWSTQLLQQYDCEEEAVRFLAMYYRSGHMGEGELILTINEVGQWNAIPLVVWVCSATLERVCPAASRP